MLVLDNDQKIDHNIEKQEVGSHGNCQNREKTDKMLWKRWTSGFVDAFLYVSSSLSKHKVSKEEKIAEVKTPSCSVIWQRVYIENWNQIFFDSLCL